MNDIKIYAFSDESSPKISEQIEALKRNALNGTELRGVDGENVSDISLQKAKEVKKQFDDSGLKVWSIGSPIGKININDDFSAHLDKFKHTLEIANIMDAKNIRLFSFYPPENEKPENCKNEVISRLGEFILASAGSGVNLCHENEKGIYGDIPERCLEIHKALPELKGIFDPANFVQCGADTLKAWDMLKDYIYYMHIKDAREDGFVVPAGFGAGNLKEVVSAFIANGGRNFTIEPHLTLFEGLGALEREGEKSGIGEFKYETAEIAFDEASNKFKALLAGIK